VAEERALVWKQQTMRMAERQGLNEPLGLAFGFGNSLPHPCVTAQHFDRVEDGGLSKMDWSSDSVAGVE
jgi:hypothetical protein